VSGLIALVHPQALVAALDPAEREDYLRRAGERVLAGQHRLASAIAGGRALYEKPADRRFSHDAPEKRQEADMLLDADARLGEDGWYARS
jgi:fatty acid synthase